MEVNVTCNSTVINLVAIYRPYPSTVNKLNMGMFIKDFSSFMEYAVVTKNMLLLGDFNVHVDDVTDYDAKRFIRLLDSCGLHQHVEGPTHVSGHTLDLLISHKMENLFQDITILRGLPSDHFAVIGQINFSHPKQLKRTISHRELGDIDLERFKQDTRKSSLYLHHRKAPPILLISTTTFYVLFLTNMPL